MTLSNFIPIRFEMTELWAS